MLPGKIMLAIVFGEMTIFTCFYNGMPYKYETF